MEQVRGIVICVDYDDLLAITLPRNARHLKEVLVVTHPRDEKTKRVVAEIPNARVFETDAFYRSGAKFNKGLAMEEGFDALGREGWILIWDADIVLADDTVFENLQIGRLYSVRRRILENHKLWKEELDWRRLPDAGDRTFAGYFQLFHADDPHLAVRPWYDVTYTHAGGGDEYFQALWPADCKHYLPYNCLHLGPRDTNWFGRVTQRMDGQQVAGVDQHRRDMQLFLSYKGWRGRKRTVRHFREHVDVERPT